MLRALYALINRSYAPPSVRLSIRHTVFSSFWVFSSGFGEFEVVAAFPPPLGCASGSFPVLPG